MSLADNLKDLSLGDIFQIIFLCRRSGVLHIRSEAICGKLYFKDGFIVSAHSETLKIDTNIAIDALREELQRIVYALFISEGSFEFELKDLNDELEYIGRSMDRILINPGLNPQLLAVEGFKLLKEANKDQRDHTLQEPDHTVERVDLKDETKKTEMPIGLEETEEQEYDFEDIKSELGIRRGNEHRKAATPGLRTLKGMIYELQNPHSASEVALLLLRFASEIMNKAVLFIVKREVVEGFGQFGVLIEEEDPNIRVMGIKISLREPSVIKDVVETKAVFKGPVEDLPSNRYLLDQLGGGWPSEVYLAPLLLGDRVAAILYGDNLPGSDPIGDTEALEVFLIQAGITLEKVLRGKRWM
jgi:Domain of unknown function (DUF4388)